MLVTRHQDAGQPVRFRRSPELKFSLGKGLEQRGQIDGVFEDPKHRTVLIKAVVLIL